MLIGIAKKNWLSRSTTSSNIMTDTTKTVKALFGNFNFLIKEYVCVQKDRECTYNEMLLICLEVFKSVNYRYGHKTFTKLNNLVICVLFVCNFYCTCIIISKTTLQR